jgi:alanine racemase
MGPKAHVWAGETRCKILGRISMDLIGIDVSALKEVPDTVELLGMHQLVDTLGDAAGTIGYEILTSLGNRYERRYVG